MEELKILKLPYTEDHFQNKIENFYHEFLSYDHSPEHIDNLLCIIHDYLLECDDGEDTNLHQTIINLRQSIFWCNQWGNVDVEGVD